MTLSVERLRERYGKYRLYSRLTNASVGSLMVAITIIAVLQFFLDLSAFPYLLLGILGPLVFGGIFFLKRDSIVLSSDEKITAILARAIPSFEAFLDKEREEDRGAALKDLNEVSAEMATWTFGTIELIEREIGKPARRFRERFQKRLLPAIRDGDTQKVRRLLELLKIIYGGFMLGNYSTENFQRWSEALENLPDREVSTSLTRSLWLTPARRMTMITLGSIVAGTTAYGFETWVGANPREALTIAITTFVGIFAGLAIFVGRAKPSEQS